MYKAPSVAGLILAVCQASQGLPCGGKRAGLLHRAADICLVLDIRQNSTGSLWVLSPCRQKNHDFGCVLRSSCVILFCVLIEFCKKMLLGCFLGASAQKQPGLGPPSPQLELSLLLICEMKTTAMLHGALSRGSIVNVDCYNYEYLT